MKKSGQPAQLVNVQEILVKAAAESPDDDQVLVNPAYVQLSTSATQMQEEQVQSLPQSQG